MTKIDRTGVQHAVTLTQQASLATQLSDFDLSLFTSCETNIAHTICLISKKLSKFYENMQRRPEKQNVIDIEQLQEGIAAEKKVISEQLQSVFGNNLKTDHNELNTILREINKVNFAKE